MFNHYAYWYSDLIKSEHLSPTMIAGAFVLDETKCGMTAASAILKFGTLWTRSFGSTTAILSVPILQVLTACQQVWPVCFAYSSKSSCEHTFFPGLTSRTINSLRAVCWESVRRSSKAFTTSLWSHSSVR